MSAAISNILPAENNDDLGDQITLLAAQINAATYCFLKLLGEFDRRRAWSGIGIRSCAHWLNWKCGIALGAARERVRVARCLDALPKINQAFAAGEVSYSKVRAMTRAATDDNEEYLLMIAVHGTASHMEKLVRRYQRVDNRQQPEREQDQFEARSLRSYQDDDGMWVIHAKLPPEQGSLVLKAIEEIVQKHKTSVHEPENVSAETPESVEQATFAEQRADALTSLAEHYIANPKLRSLAGHERCQVMLHVDINTLRQQSDCNHKHNHKHLAHLEQQWVSPQTAKRLSCDASLVTVLKDEQGKVLNIGRNSRVIPPRIRRALDIRDETCRYPGCTCNQYVDIHHIVHWADGGETKLDNLVKLCRFHHRELHKGCFLIETRASGLIFKTATGKKIPNNPTLPESRFSDFVARQSSDIDCRTGASRWTGEPMDYGMAVDGLLRRQQKNFNLTAKDQ